MKKNLTSDNLFKTNSQQQSLEREGDTSTVKFSPFRLSDKAREFTPDRNRLLKTEALKGD
jgi:hypothetical protein